MQRTLLALIAATTCTLAMAASQSAVAADADLGCKLHYSLTGWSLIYKHSTGSGTIHCENGQNMRVHVSTKALGVTAGKWRIDDGTGDFTDVRRLSDVLGRYAVASAEVGVVKAGETHLLTKGEVSLALAGKGEGVDIGVDAGEFTISR
jgi:hypothetical protein